MHGKQKWCCMHGFNSITFIVFLDQKSWPENGGCARVILKWSEGSVRVNIIWNRNKTNKQDQHWWLNQAVPRGHWPPCSSTMFMCPQHNTLQESSYQSSHQYLFTFTLHMLMASFHLHKRLVLFVCFRFPWNIDFFFALLLIEYN